MDKTMTSRQFKYFERDAKLLLKARSMRALPRIDEARKENSIKDIPSTLCKVRRFTLEEKEYLPNRAKQKNGSVLDSLRYGSN